MAGWGSWLVQPASHDCWYSTMPDPVTVSVGWSNDTWVRSLWMFVDIFEYCEDGQDVLIV